MRVARVTIRSLLIAVAIAALFASVWRAYRDAAPKKLEPFLAAMRRSDRLAATEALYADSAANHRLLKQWLARILVKGGTTQDEIVARFGKGYDDLDRPARDNTITLQYRAGYYGRETRIVFDFHRDTHVLIDWSISEAICGFCPHVFAFDGRWRLEGKMLAGCIGSLHKGTDTLLVPRLTARDGRLRVRLSNLAPEVEFIDGVQLGEVALSRNEELDVGQAGELYAWAPSATLPLQPDEREGPSAYSVSWHESSQPNVIVLEVRNTSEFEEMMRDAILRGAERQPSSLRVDLGGGETRLVEPVGTKFLRRVVLPVPEGCRSVRIQAPGGFWRVNRVFLGRGRIVDHETVWTTGMLPETPNSAESRRLAPIDYRRLRLDPNDEVVLDFKEERQAKRDEVLRYVLRMTGYYEFLPTDSGRESSDREHSWRIE